MTMPRSTPVTRLTIVQTATDIESPTAPSAEVSSGSSCWSGGALTRHLSAGISRGTAAEQGGNGHDEDEQVPGDAAAQHVLDVEVERFAHAELAAAPDLPQPGDARLDLEPPQVARGEHVGFPGQHRPRADP